MSDLDPLFSDAAHHRELSGLSGALVALVTRDGETWFVRKASRDVDGSERLREQMRRQVAFCSAVTGGVRAPEVLRDGDHDGRYFFDMQYVPGLDGASYLQSAELHGVRELAERLGQLLRDLSRPVETPAPEPIDLFACLARRVSLVHERQPTLTDDDLGRVFRLLEPLRLVGPLAPTRVHGDLTLENIIVDEAGATWVVDLLDGPADHWWFDVAKLHQDLTGGWYQRRVGPISRAVVDYLSTHILDVARSLDPIYGAAHLPLLVTSFVRILPYSTDARDRDMVVARIRHLTSIGLEKDGQP